MNQENSAINGYLTIEQVMEKYGVSHEQVLYAIRSGKISKTKEEDRIMLLHTEVKKYFNRPKDKYICIWRVKKIHNVSEGQIRNAIESGMISTVKSGEKILLDESETSKYFNDLKNRYKTIKQIMEENNVSESEVRYALKIGKISSISSENTILLDKAEAGLYFDTINKCKVQIQKVENDSNWVKISSIKPMTRLRITNLIRENKVSDKQARILYKGGHKYVYVHSSLISDVEKGDILVSYKKPGEGKRFDLVKENLNKKDFYDISKIENAIQKLLSEKFHVKGKKSFTLEDIENITGISVSDIKQEIEYGTLNDSFIVRKDGDFKNTKIFSNGVRILLRERSYISAQEISKITGIHQTTVVRIISRKTTENEKIYFCEHTYIKKDLALEVIIEYLRTVVFIFDDFNKILELRLKLIDSQYHETFNLVVDFLKLEVKRLEESTLREKKSDFGKTLNSMECLLDVLEKELYTYDNDEIEDLIMNDKIKKSYIAKISKFINFVRSELGDKCEYTRRVGQSLVQQLSENQEGEKHKIYSEEEWARYYLFLKDIDRHIIRSFDNDRYAQVWLYCLLHLSITWRCRDIIDKMPNVPIEIIDVYNLEWFKSGGNFTLSMAQQVLEYVSFSLDGIITYKNKMNLHFNIPLSLKIPTAVSLVVNEINRRKNNQENIFYRFMTTPPTKKNEFEAFFSDDPILKSFSNLKATRTLITFNYCTAVRTVGTAGVAYELSRYGRSHRQKFGEITNTTSIYFHFENIDGSPEDMAYQILERGGFGYLYIKILETCFKKEEIELLSQDEITDVVKDMRDEITPVTLENISENIIESKFNTGLGLRLISEMKNIEKISPRSREVITQKLEKEIIDKYKVIAKEMFPGKSEDLEKYIEDKCKSIDEIIKEKSLSNYGGLLMLNEIINGGKNCITNNSNCIFDSIEIKEKCTYKNSGTCIGCKNNLMMVPILYELNNLLNDKLDEVIKGDDFSNLDLIRETSIIQNYLSILIEAKAHFQNLDKNFLSAFINENEIKLKLNKLLEQNKFKNK